MAVAKKSKLLAVAPEAVEPKRPKVVIFGPAGVGKTWSSLLWPKVYFIDVEGGADLPEYREKLKAAGGMYFGPEQGALSFDTVIDQIEALATENHSYKTVVIDSITKLFNTAIVDEQIRLGDKDAFGASKKGPVRQMARLIRWLNRTDMNAIIIAHEKELWGMNEKNQREAIGLTFDADAKLGYELHLVLRISKLGVGETAKRYANIGKSRLPAFPEGEKFEWNFDTFSERYGKDVIEKAVRPVVLALPEQLAEINRLLDIVKLPDGLVDKWLKKAEVEEFEEMDSATIGKCIEYLQKQLTTASELAKT